MDANKKKLVVQAREGELRTFGSTASPFANEIGVIMQNIVSQRLTGWSEAKEHDRVLVYNCLLVSKFSNKVVYIMFNTIITYNVFFFFLLYVQEKFDVDLKDQQWLEIVERHCRERYKEHRSACHKRYKELKLERKDPLQFPPKSVKLQEDWEWMCGHFESEKFQVF